MITDPMNDTTLHAVNMRGRTACHLDASDWPPQSYRQWIVEEGCAACTKEIAAGVEFK